MAGRETPGRWGLSPGKTLLELPPQTQPCVPTYQWNFLYVLIYDISRNHMKTWSEPPQWAGLWGAGILHQAWTPLGWGEWGAH